MSVDDFGYLETIKVEAAKNSELLKLEHRLKNNPSVISILDYTILAALGKQIPKKLTKTKIPGIGKCPNCKTELCIDDSDLHYCPTCGQRITLDKEAN